MEGGEEKEICQRRRMNEMEKAGTHITFRVKIRWPMPSGTRSWPVSQPHTAYARKEGTKEGRMDRGTDGQVSRM